MEYELMINITFMTQLYKDQKFQNKSKYRHVNTRQYNACVLSDIPLHFCVPATFNNNINILIKCSISAANLKIFMSQFVMCLPLTQGSRKDGLLSVSELKVFKNSII